VSGTAIQITDSKQKQIEFSYDKLCKEELTEFSTSRNKNAKDISETWRGIALLPWLDKLGYSNWHTLRCVSSDAYEVKLHRTELDAMPAYIALVHETEFLAESDLRVVFPQTRDNLWLRGISKLYLEPFEGVAHPRQLFIWEDNQSGLAWENSLLTLEKLMHQAFRQNSGTVTFLDSKMHTISLEYPAQLGKASISTELNGTLSLYGITLIGYMQIEDIIYLQCGPYAYVKRAYLPSLQSIGTALLWDWATINRYEITGIERTSFSTSPKQDYRDTKWIELE
jgi:hypothetical protein